jgi:hypothetical protein
MSSSQRTVSITRMASPCSDPDPSVAITDELLSDQGVDDADGQFPLGHDGSPTATGGTGVTGQFPAVRSAATDRSTAAASAPIAVITPR